MIKQEIFKKKDALLEIEVTKELAIQQVRSPSDLEAAIQEEMARDPKFQSLQQEQQAATQQMTRLKADTSPKNSPEVKQLQEHLRTLDQQIQEYRISKEAEIRAGQKTVPNDDLAQVMRKYILRRRAAEKDLVDLEDQYTEKMEKVQQKGETSGPLAILESQIALLQEVEKTLDMQLRSWDVQDQAGSERVRIMQNARAFKSINKLERNTIAFIGGFAALCFTCLGSVLISRYASTPKKRTGV